MTPQNYRLLVQYDGTNYSGWQIQANATSVQGTITAAIEKITGDRVNLIGSGRTDAGVHARGQVANFLCALKLHPEAWLRALNTRLPPDIRVLTVSRAALSFHAQHGATAKTYRYHMVTAPVLPPWESRYALHWPRPLDLPEMRRAARLLLGRHDMRSFAASGTRVHDFVRRITQSTFIVGNHRLAYTVTADGFLQHMVRSIVGTLLEVGSGRFSAADFGRILRAQDRRQAGKTAPPQGLFLEHVVYGRKTAAPGHRGGN